MRSRGPQVSVPKAVGVPLVSSSGTYHIAADTSRCFVVKMQLWGNHTHTRTREVLRWFHDLALVSFAAAATAHRRSGCTYEIFLRLGGSYVDAAIDTSVLRKQKAVGTVRLSVFRSEGEADDGAKALMSKRTCTWITFLRLDADDALYEAGFTKIEESAPHLPVGDVVVRAARKIRMWACQHATMPFGKCVGRIVAQPTMRHA